MLIDCVHFLCIVIDQNCTILFVCSRCLFNPASITKLPFLCFTNKKKKKTNDSTHEAGTSILLRVFVSSLASVCLRRAPRLRPAFLLSSLLARLPLVSSSPAPVSLYDSPRPPLLTVTGNFASLPFVAVTKGAGALSQAMLHAVA